MAKKSKSTQRRVQDIADELGQAAVRLREALDEARPATASELEAVRNDLKALTARVGKLEAGGASAAKRAPATKTTTRRAAAPRASATAASKVPAARAAAKKRSS